MSLVPSIPRDSNDEAPSPLDALPDELLEYILLLVLDPTKSNAAEKSALFWLRLVSSRWMRVIDGYPALWSTIVVATGPAGVAFQLERTKQSPLSIQCELFPPLFQELFDQSTSLIAQHINRAHTITISVPYISIPRHFNVPAPNLEHLSIERTGLPLTRELFKGHMPKLKRFRLKKTDISSFPLGLSGLEELELSDVYGVDGIQEALTIDSLHQILSMYPDLKHLTVRGIRSSARQPLPLQLPSLETLIIASDSASGGFDALSLFSDLPSSTLKLHIHGVGTALNPSMWRLIIQWLHRAKGLTITVYDIGGFRLASLEGVVDIELYSGGSPWRTGSAHTVSLLGNILADAERDSPLHAQTIISLVREHNRETTEVMGSFLNWLQVPVVTPGGENYYPLPRLREIHLKPELFNRNHLRSLLALRSANLTDQTVPDARSPDLITAVWIPSGPNSAPKNILQELTE
ncbi:hypothetical protein FRC01_005229 [Tulasnella sp. 417]|nr:hypothetical protein FRC01_005229 [Tulasnella sp. 417]